MRVRLIVITHLGSESARSPPASLFRTVIDKVWTSSRRPRLGLALGLGSIPTIKPVSQSRCHSRSYLKELFVSRFIVAKYSQKAPSEFFLHLVVGTSHSIISSLTIMPSCGGKIVCGEEVFDPEVCLCNSPHQREFSSQLLGTLGL